MEHNRNGRGHERRLSGDEVHFRKPSKSPLRRNNGGPSSGNNTPKRLISRQSVGSDRSVENSPLHPQSTARAGGRKGSSQGSHSHSLAPSTPLRSRLQSVTRGGNDTSPDNIPAVPKFGDWDDKDPTSADGYTQLFNLVRDEKQSEGGKVPTIIPSETSYANVQKRKSCGCFPWRRS